MAKFIDEVWKLVDSERKKHETAKKKKRKANKENLELFEKYSAENFDGYISEFVNAILDSWYDFIEGNYKKWVEYSGVSEDFPEPKGCKVAYVDVCYYKSEDEHYIAMECNFGELGQCFFYVPKIVVRTNISESISAIKFFGKRLKNVLEAEGIQVKSIENRSGMIPAESYKLCAKRVDK